MMTYAQAHETYKISHGTQKYNEEKGCWEDINFDDYDLVVASRSKGYTSQEYVVLKNTTNLSRDEIANVCDPNNFGYYHHGNVYEIYID